MKERVAINGLMLVLRQHVIGAETPSLTLNQVYNRLVDHINRMYREIEEMEVRIKCRNESFYQ